jgi:hypothetical protein
MNTSIETTSIPFEIRMILAVLQELKAWNDEDNQFLAYISEPSWDPPEPPKKMSSQLKSVVKAALQGMDIGQYYPEFVRELMANTMLRGMFLLELEEGRHKFSF